MHSSQSSAGGGNIGSAWLEGRRRVRRCGCYCQSVLVTGEARVSMNCEKQCGYVYTSAVMYAEAQGYATEGLSEAARNAPTSCGACSHTKRHHDDQQGS
jgi:hypothetical protein